MLKLPEVVRSEIECAERWYCEGTLFVADNSTATLTGYAKTHEIRRQKWVHILKNSPHPDIIFLRQVVHFEELQRDQTKTAKYLKGLNLKNCKSLKNLTGHSKFKEIVRIIWNHLKNNFSKDIFITELLDYLGGNKVGTGVEFTAWLSFVNSTYSTMVSNIHSAISEKIHNAAFDPTDMIPEEYVILKKPPFDRYVNIIMCFYQP